MISHGIIPFLPPNCAKFIFSLSDVTTKKLSSALESFLVFSAKRCEYKITKKDGRGKSRKVMAKYFVKSVGTL